MTQQRDAAVPLCVPEIRGNEWSYVRECLDTGWVSSSGLFVDRFERTLAEYIGARYAVAVVNGTAALHIALLVAGVRPGDEVLVSALTFIAPANAIRYVGAWPVFIDADSDYWQMDPLRVSEFLRDACERRHGVLVNRATGRRVRAILPVDILGHPVAMGPLRDLARRYELVLVQDATESLGAEYQGERVGRGSSIACFSFNGNKIITTGGGGMIVTDEKDWAAKARYLTTQAKDDEVEYVHTEIGYNYRLTNLQAAMGVAQMEQLPSYLEAKRRIARRYADGLGDLPGIATMRSAPWAASTFWMYTVVVDDETFGMDSRRLLSCLSESGIQTRPLWQPLHLSPAHRDSPPADCPVAERLYRQALSLPCSVGLSVHDQQRVIEAIRALARRSSTAEKVRTGARL